MQKITVGSNEYTKLTDLATAYNTALAALKSAGIEIPVGGFLIGANLYLKKKKMTGSDYVNSDEIEINPLLIE
jgi:hypothetical protein